MMNIRQRSVNVSRTELLEKLKENRKIHAKEYADLLLEFRARLESDLKAALEKVSKAKNNEKLKQFRFNVVPPQNYTSQYDEVIEMLEMSVDEVINLDAESFKAYIKNEWSWSNQLITSKALYAAAGSFLGNSNEDF